jgi:group I intron endonuclease
MDSGIYTIYNKINGKQYVGSSINIRKRWNEHRSKLRRHKHHSRILQYAWDKYGEGAFIFMREASCPHRYLLKLEQHYINCLKPEYNATSTAGRTTFTDEQKASISLKLKGHVVTEKSKLASTLANTGNKYNQGRKQPPSFYEKANKKIKQITKDGEIVAIWLSINEAGKALGIAPTGIGNCINGWSNPVLGLFGC